MTSSTDAKPGMPMALRICLLAPAVVALVLDGLGAVLAFGFGALMGFVFGLFASATINSHAGAAAVGLTAAGALILLATGGAQPAENLVGLAWIVTATAVGAWQGQREHAAFQQTMEAERERCPFCRETIAAEALRCPHCSSNF